MLDDNLINEIKQIPIEDLTKMLKPYGIKIKTEDKEIFFNKEFRKEIWDRYSILGVDLTILKGLVQNPMPLTYEMIEQQKKITVKIQTELTEIMDEIEDTYNELAWDKNYLDIE